MKRDFDSLKLKSTKETNDWRNKLDERCDEVKKLEESIKTEKTLSLQLNKTIADLTEKVEKLQGEMVDLKQSYEAKLVQCAQDHKVEKEISGTIILQQKKLLDYMQLKLGGAFAGFIESSAAHTGAGTESNGHNLINLLNKKFKSSSNSNPLLANLQKTTNQQYLNKPTSEASKKAGGKKDHQKLSEIEAELNSNYVTYSELNKKNAAGGAKSTSEAKIELSVNAGESTGS